MDLDKLSAAASYAAKAQQLLRELRDAAPRDTVRREELRRLATRADDLCIPLDRTVATAFAEARSADTSSG